VSYDAGENSRAHIIEHDAPAPWNLFQAPKRRRLKNIEASKKYKTRKNILPTQRNSDEGGKLSGNFINDGVPGIGYATFAGHDG
jgi:hypothetical protein